MQMMGFFFLFYLRSTYVPVHLSHLGMDCCRHESPTLSSETILYSSWSSMHAFTNFVLCTYFWGYAFFNVHRIPVSGRIPDVSKGRIYNRRCIRLFLKMGQKNGFCFETLIMQCRTKINKSKVKCILRNLFLWLNIWHSARMDIRIQCIPGKAVDPDPDPH